MPKSLLIPHGTYSWGFPKKDLLFQLSKKIMQRNITYRLIIKSWLCSTDAAACNSSSNFPELLLVCGFNRHISGSRCNTACIYMQYLKIYVFLHEAHRVCVCWFGWVFKKSKNLHKMEHFCPLTKSSSHFVIYMENLIGIREILCYWGLTVLKSTFPHCYPYAWYMFCLFCLRWAKPSYQLYTKVDFY